MQVEVLEAREILKMDSMGSSDPFVKIFTDPKRIVKTATKKNTLNPVWENEVFYLMVQVRTGFSWRSAPTIYAGLAHESFMG